jgi:hypothetical protein
MNATPSAARRRDLAAMRERALRTQHAHHAPAERFHRVSLWLPTSLIFVLMAPFAILLTPLLFLLPRPYRPSPSAVVILGEALLSLSGTHVEVDTPAARVRLHLF